MHANCFMGLLAQATPPAGSPSGPPAQSPMTSLLFPLLLMGIIIYFLMLRPQQQQAKRQAKLLSTLKSGDEVITASGIVGTVVTVKDKTVTLRSADAKFEVTKASITEVTPKEAGAAS